MEDIAPEEGPEDLRLSLRERTVAGVAPVDGAGAQQFMEAAKRLDRRSRLKVAEEAFLIPDPPDPPPEPLLVGVIQAFQDFELVVVVREYAVFRRRIEERLEAFLVQLQLRNGHETTSRSQVGSGRAV